MESTAGSSRSASLNDVFARLRSHTQLTVGDVVAMAGVSRPTAASLLAQLVDRGLAYAETTDEASVGRPANRWSLHPHAGFVIAMDLMASAYTVSAADLSGRVLSASAGPLRHDDRELRLHAVVRRLAALRQRWEPSHGTLHQIVVSTTGIVDGEGVIRRSDLVPAWAGFRLSDELTEHLGVPVRVENDINMAAMGEFCVRRQEGAIAADGDLLLGKMNRGLLTGTVLGGKLHRGRQWAAGEVNDALDLALDESTQPDGEWLDRAALIIDSAAAVLDPDLIVLSGPTSASRGTMSRVLERMAQHRAGMLPLATDVGLMNEEAAVVGALYTALDDAISNLLLMDNPTPIPLVGLEDLSYSIQKGLHPEMNSQVSRTANDRVRVGVVGVGARSNLALHAEDPANNGIITAICDPSPLVGERAQSRLHKKPSDLVVTAEINREFIESVDVAFVTSPDDTHAELTCQLLEAGVPVYLEKPLAITIDSATRILATAEQTGVKLYVGHNMRHMNVVKSMRELIQAGRIGEVKAIWCRHFVGSGGDFYFKDWHATREHGTGLLLQKAAHDIDVMHWLAGSHTTRVVGMGGLTLYGDIQDRRDRSDQLMGDWYSLDNWPPLSQRGLNPIVDVEDLSMILLEMQSGVFGSYEQCHYTPDYWRNYTVIGTEGRLENFGDGEGGWIRLWNQRTHYNADGNESFPILGDAKGHNDADFLTVSEFLRFVREGVTTQTSPVSAWQAVATGVQATESIRNGSNPRAVPELDGRILDYFANNQVK